MGNSEPSPYQRLKTIGQGAMGQILLAKDRHLLREVALKEMHAEIRKNPQVLGRFLREAQITAQLDHPNIIPVYAFEITEDGSLSYAMKVIEGHTLKEYIQNAKAAYTRGEELPEDHDRVSLLRFFLDVCDAMHFSHQRGVIHRDLKPANIMIGPHNEVYVMDWGIARIMGGLQESVSESEAQDAFHASLNLDHTQAGQILGTPRYMSPQQAAGKNNELDGRSDLFALGLILFELLTLKPAFRASNPVELLKKILTVNHEDFTHFSLSEPIPRELKGIVKKAIQKKPEDRYNTVKEMADDIRAFLRGEAVSAAPDNTWQSLMRWVSHNKTKAMLAMFASLLFSVGLVLLSLVYLQYTTKIAHQRELKINTYFNRASQQGQKINQHFAKMENLLRGLATKTVRMLESGADSPDPYYIAKPYLAPEQHPSKLFGGKISLQWPTMAFAPGVTEADTHGKVKKIVPLRHHFIDMVFQSHPKLPLDLPETQKIEWVGQKGLPMMWAHVSLKEGVIYMFPGIGFDTPGYDPRIRGFYLLSARKYGVYWGAPYFDLLSGALLPVTMSMYGHDGEFLGVAGIDLRVFYVIEELLTLKDYPQMSMAYLVDGKGKTIVRSSDIAKANVNDKPADGFKTPPFEQKEVRQAIQEGKYGGLIHEGQTLWSYTRLNNLGWYYVTQIPKDGL